MIRMQINTCICLHVCLICTIVQVKFLDKDNPKDSYNGHYVEVSGDGGEVGVLCYDDTDTMMATVLCRSLPNPSFLSTYLASSLDSYKGL